MIGKILIVLLIIYWAAVYIWGLISPDSRDRVVVEALNEFYNKPYKLSKAMDKTSLFYVIYGLLILLLM